MDRALATATDCIKRFEDFEPEPYLDQAKIWTIGYGTTVLPNGLRVMADTPAISEAQATQYLLDHVNRRVMPYVQNLPGWSRLNANQQAACISMAYNIGAGPNGFAGSSVARDIAAGRLQDVPAHMRLWNKTRINGKLTVSNGLVNRREKEIALFNKPVTEN